MESNFEKLDKLICLREVEKKKLEKMKLNLDAQKDKYQKECARFDKLQEQIDRIEFFILKNKLKKVGIDGAFDLDKVIKVYEEHKESKGDNVNEDNI